MVRLGASAAVYGAIAASVWGVKLETAAEPVAWFFGTMLHDMRREKRLLDHMQSSRLLRSSMPNRFRTLAGIC